jgi:hypothetical protein
MAFVLEGQLDSSQARCAWSHEENSPSRPSFGLLAICDLPVTDQN